MIDEQSLTKQYDFPDYNVFHYETGTNWNSWDAMIAGTEPATSSPATSSPVASIGPETSSPASTPAVPAAAVPAAAAQNQNISLGQLLSQLPGEPEADNGQLITTGLSGSGGGSSTGLLVVLLIAGVAGYVIWRKYGR